MIEKHNAPGERLPRATELAHVLLRPRMDSGDRVIDATVGNGHDTGFLAEAVGETGHVFGFDIQAEAIAATRHRLKAAGLAGRVTLIEGCHSVLMERMEGEIAAVMFNLGYLPGGDKSRVTRAETTLAALESALARLRVGGLVTVVVYPGHQGGDTEAAVVEQWAATLDPANSAVATYHFLNRANHPPRLIVIERA